MSHTAAVIEQITDAFTRNAYPGDAFLQGSFEGCEPYEEVGPFQGKTDWQALEPELLDSHGAALSFFSEAGFRFFLPAFLLADLRGQLQYAEPLFHLTNGFHDFAIDIEKAQRVFHIVSGKSRLINPQRYGAMTSYDYARYRLSVFTREEAAAIVAYLQWKRATDEDGFETESIDAALEQFWLARAKSAPTAERLQRHLAEEQAYVDAIRADADAAGGQAAETDR